MINCCVMSGTPNKSRQQGRFAPGPLNSGPCLKRYAYKSDRVYAQKMQLVKSKPNPEHIVAKGKLSKEWI